MEVKWLQPLHCEVQESALQNPPNQSTAITTTEMEQEDLVHAKTDINVVHQDLLNHASHCFQTIIEKCKTNLQYHGPALQSFVNNFHKITTDSQFNTALHTFNKSHLSATAASKIKQRYRQQASKPHRLSTSVQIPVSGTTPARRRSNISRGRRQHGAGRPAKSSKKTKARRQHLLAQCVNKNVMLGKSHYKK